MHFQNSRTGSSVEDLIGLMTRDKNNQPSELLQDHQLKFQLLQKIILSRYTVILVIS